MENLTPQQIVNELDKYIIGQQEAKKKCSSCFAQSVSAQSFTKRTTGRNQS